MSWFDRSGQNCDAVIGTRVTLIRNVEGFPFALGRAESITPEERAGLISRLSERIGESFTSFALSSIDPAVLGVLVKKRFVDQELAAFDHSAVILLNEERGISVILGGSDQVTIRVLLPGEAPEEALRAALTVESRLDSAFRLAFSESYGYLTSSTAFLGSATEFSLLLHLPASGIPGNINRFTNIEPLRGDLCFISSEPFPGITEEEQISRLRALSGKMIANERSTRSALKSNAVRLCDRVMRAYGLLSNACLLSEDELYRLWSDLRLGAVIGLPGLPAPEELNSILMAALISSGDEGEPDAERAALLNRKLAAFRERCGV